jgi:hypothetical protein
MLGTTALLGTLALAAPATAERLQASHATTHAVAAVAYQFHGNVVSAPGAAATSLQVQVTGGNGPALHALIGSAQPATFTLDGRTKITVWSGRHPVHGTTASLQAGDPVNLTVYGVRRAPLAALLATPVRTIGDTAALAVPHGRMFTYYGTAVSLDPNAHTLTIDITSGNWRALHSLIGSPARETFTYGPGTVFLHWQNGRPHLVLPADVRAGDSMTLRVFAPTWNVPMSTLTSTPLWRANDHEPQSMVDQTSTGQ